LDDLKCDLCIKLLLLFFFLAGRIITSFLILEMLILQASVVVCTYCWLDCGLLAFRSW